MGEISMGPEISHAPGQGGLVAELWVLRLSYLPMSVPPQQQGASPRTCLMLWTREAQGEGMKS